MTVPEPVQVSLRILRMAYASSGRIVTGVAEVDRLGRVVAAFDRVGAEWALVGAHAAGLLTEPRATEDVDFVIDERRLQAVLRTLTEEFGDLRVTDMGPALRLGALQVDLIRSTTHPLFREALRQVRTVEGWRVPRTEVLIALKFSAAVSPWRGQTKRIYDVADLRALFVAGGGREDLDGDLMMRLAGLVYPGAEAEFASLLDRIERGDPISI